MIDTVGGAAATALAHATKPAGLILTAATDALDADMLPSAPLFVAVHPDGARLQRLVDDVAAGDVDITITARFPLAEPATRRK